VCLTDDHNGLKNPACEQTDTARLKLQARLVNLARLALQPLLEQLEHLVLLRSSHAARPGQTAPLIEKSCESLP
jgi:hypothetical protein